ncbi:MAG: hypothetical protein Kow00109_23470 [Acidobacteriota bacterium]
MPTITIDGVELQVPAGTTVIQAAEMAGIYIPRYCYHPGLRIAGSCRMCLVEVEKLPNLQIACNTVVQDGMKVTTDSPRVKQARQGMLEFLLSNHPLDCPVCDQSGECDLQNYYMEYGRYQSRFFENKTKRKKAFPIGPHVMLDQERCILCTRCVRFTEEVSKSHELGVFQRGHYSYIDLYPGKELNNPYSGNVIDICPVGALTEREFRFQCRVWYLKEAPSICPNCARGCNISVHFNTERRHKAQGRRVMRIKPRFHPEVNRWWICDHGRFDYHFIDRDRIEFPALQEDGLRRDVDWDTALSHAAELIRETLAADGPGAVGVALSPRLANEELAAAKRLFLEGLGIEHLALANPWEELGPEDELLMRADRNPNRRGAQELGLAGDLRELLQKAAGGEVKLVYLFHHQLDDPEALELLRQVPRLIYQGTNWNPAAAEADVVLAGAVPAEKRGTFTNFEGRLQRFAPCFAPLEDARPDFAILADLGRRLEVAMPADEDEALRGAFGLSWDEVGDRGVLLAELSRVEA